VQAILSASLADDEAIRQQDTNEHSASNANNQPKRRAAIEGHLRAPSVATLGITSLKPHAWKALISASAQLAVCA
jgi:hypothetical protein